MTDKRGSKKSLDVRRVSLAHNHERAETNWKHTKTKAKSIGFFARHIADKRHQRDILTKFMLRMKTQMMDDNEELAHRCEEYEDSDTQPNIKTIRPKSPKATRKVIPYPEAATYTRYEVPADCKCPLCDRVFQVFHEDEAYPCRICDAVYHRECLEGCGDLTDTDKFNIDQAHDNIGWSCPTCANISLLLTTDEVKTMTDEFEKIDFNQDAQITLPEYLLHHSRKVSLTDGRGRLLPDETTRLSQEFRFMDQDGDNKLDWWEFVNHESRLYLAKKDKYDLMNELSQKELCAAKATFNILDKDRDGKIKEYEVKQSFQTWFKQFEHGRTSSEDKIERDSESLEMHTTVFAEGIMEADSSGIGDVRWEDFILNQALYILVARPNIRIPAHYK